MVHQERWRRLKQSGYKPAPPPQKAASKPPPEQILAKFWAATEPVPPALPPPPNRKADIAAARALEAIDADLAAFTQQYPARPAMSLTVNDLAKATNNHRSKYSRLLKQAGVQQKPLVYLRARLPEVRMQRGA